MFTCAGGDVLVHGCVRVVARSAAAVGVYGERGRALDVEALLVKRSWCLRLCVCRTDLPCVWSSVLACSRGQWARCACGEACACACMEERVCA